MEKKYVSWRRVSTKKQGSSGLGLAAQKEIIRYFIEHEQGDWIADYEECYTGTELGGCTELWKAIEFAKANNAILIIAKTDRFRNTVEALQVYDQMGDGNIMFCDLPHTDKFTLTLFFALAEREALIVSIRTRQALEAKAARGEKTGGATDAWVRAWKDKSDEELAEEYRRRGATRNERFLARRDVVATLRVLHKVFPNATESENAAEWHWGNITTRGEYKDIILGLMRDYKEMDETGKLFVRWNFEESDIVKLQVKLCSWLQTIHKSILYKLNS